MPFCEYCGSQRSDAAKFCPKCGRSVEHIFKDQSIEPKSAADDLSLPKRTKRTTLLARIGFCVVASIIIGLLLYKNSNNNSPIAAPIKAKITTEISQQTVSNGPPVTAEPAPSNTPVQSNAKYEANTPIKACGVAWGVPPISAWRASPNKQKNNQVFGTMVEYNVSGLDYSCLLGEYKPDQTYLSFAAGDKLEIITWKFYANNTDAKNVKNYLISQFGAAKNEYFLGKAVKVSIWGNKGGYVQSFINDYKRDDFSISYSRELYD